MLSQLYTILHDNCINIHLLIFQICSYNQAPCNWYQYTAQLIAARSLFHKTTENQWGHRFLLNPVCKELDHIYTKHNLAAFAIMNKTTLNVQFLINCKNKVAIIIAGKIYYIINTYSVLNRHRLLLQRSLSKRRVGNFVKFALSNFVTTSSYKHVIRQLSTNEIF